MLPCNHERAPFGSPICLHLRTRREPWFPYVKWYTGSGFEAELICKACADERESGSATTTELVCQECFELATTKYGYQAGVGGQPEIEDRPQPLNTRLQETPLPRELGTVVDIAPLDGGGASVWLLLGEDGGLSSFDASTGEWSRMASMTVPTEPDDERWWRHALRRRLYASARGDFAAVVNDYRCYGQIIDLRSGAVTKNLDGGDYHPDTVPFSFAFTDWNGRAVAIHRTKWNRLLWPEAVGRVKLVEVAGVKVEMRELKEQQALQGLQLDDIKLILPLLLPEPERKHLLILARDPSTKYKRTSILKEELRHLRSLGLIKMKPNHTVGQLPEEFELADHFDMTERGRRWVARYSEIEGV